MKMLADADKTRMIGYRMLKKLCHPILERYGQTDRQTDGQNSYINIARQYADER